MLDTTKLQSALSDVVVCKVLPEIMRHMTVIKGLAVINTSTGSGKTLLVPPSLASLVDEQVLVLEPRRFLAINAAETVCELGGYTLGNEISYAIGVRGREVAMPFHSSKVVYTTYGYALSSNLISTAKVIFIDEAHEQGLDMALCKAILKHRMDRGEQLTVAVMSATMDGDSEIAYWPISSTVRNFSIDQKLFDCTRLHEPGWNTTDAVMSLITDHSRKGILVFLPGKGEITEAMAQLADKAASLEMNLEICQLHGDSDHNERVKASNQPDAKCVAKVVFGTNVIESGVNFPWVDGGISSGTGRELSYDPTGAKRLQLIDLPSWRLLQQEGRVDRFQDGVFILIGHTPWDSRPVHTVPEILRVPLTALLMHCAALNVDSRELDFQHAPNHRALVDASIYLRTLGFITSAGRLTDDGKFVSTLPIGIEASAFLAHAKKLGVHMSAAIVAAGVMSIESIKKEFIRAHGFVDFCDSLDSVIAFATAVHMTYFQKVSYDTRKAAFDRYNIGNRRFKDAEYSVNALAKILGVAPDYESYLAYDRDTQSDAAVKFIAWFKQCMLAAHANHVTDSIMTGHRGTAICGHQLARSSCVTAYIRPVSQLIASATFRDITPKNGRRFTVSENVTLYTPEDLIGMATYRPDLAVHTVGGILEDIRWNGHIVHTRYKPDPIAESGVAERAVVNTPPTPEPSMLDPNMTMGDMLSALKERLES